jgi:hypothetical protein
MEETYNDDAETKNSAPEDHFERCPKPMRNMVK